AGRRLGGWATPWPQPPCWPGLCSQRVGLAGPTCPFQGGAGRCIVAVVAGNPCNGGRVGCLFRCIVSFHFIALHSLHFISFHCKVVGVACHRATLQRNRCSCRGRGGASKALCVCRPRNAIHPGFLPRQASGKATQPMFRAEHPAISAVPSRWVTSLSC